MRTWVVRFVVLIIKILFLLQMLLIELCYWKKKISKTVCIFYSCTWIHLGYDTQLICYRFSTKKMQYSWFSYDNLADNESSLGNIVHSWLHCLNVWSIHSFQFVIHSALLTVGLPLQPGSSSDRRLTCLLTLLWSFPLSFYLLKVPPNCWDAMSAYFSQHQMINYFYAFFDFSFYFCTENKISWRERINALTNTSMTFENLSINV